jgi:hypothetical protein
MTFDEFRQSVATLSAFSFREKEDACLLCSTADPDTLSTTFSQLEEANRQRATKNNVVSLEDSDVPSLHRDARSMITSIRRIREEDEHALEEARATESLISSNPSHA